MSRDALRPTIRYSDDASAPPSASRFPRLAPVPDRSPMKTPPAVTTPTATHSSGLVRSRNRTRSNTATNSGLMVTNTSDDNTDVIDSDVTHRPKCTASSAPASIVTGDRRSCCNSVTLRDGPVSVTVLHFGTGLLPASVLPLRHICNGRSSNVDSASRQNVVTRGSVPASFMYVDVPDTPRTARMSPAQARPPGRPLLFCRVAALMVSSICLARFPSKSCHNGGPNRIGTEQGLVLPVDGDSTGLRVPLDLQTEVLCHKTQGEHRAAGREDRDNLAVLRVDGEELAIHERCTLADGEDHRCAAGLEDNLAGLCIPGDGTAQMLHEGTQGNERTVLEQCSRSIQCDSRAIHSHGLDVDREDHGVPGDRMRQRSVGSSDRLADVHGDSRGVRGATEITGPSDEVPAGGRGCRQLDRDPVSVAGLVGGFGDRAGTRHVRSEGVPVDIDIDGEARTDIDVHRHVGISPCGVSVSITPLDTLIHRVRNSCHRGAAGSMVHSLRRGARDRAVHTCRIGHGVGTDSDGIDREGGSDGVGYR